MSKVSTKWISLVGLTAIAVACTMAGCAGSKTDDSNSSGGANNSGGADGEGGSSSTNGGKSSNGGSKATQSGSATGGSAAASTGYPVDADGAYVCRKGVATGPSIAPGTSGTWGSASAVAGGTFTYQQADADKVTLDAATTPGSVVVAGTVTMAEYTGFGLYFKDPVKCWDVSAFTGGIRVTMGGDLGGGELLFQVQTNSNYPVDKTNNKGGCTDPDQWSGACANNTTTKLTIEATPKAIDIPWSSIIGGQPNATVDTTEVLGIQWQVNCTGATDCAVNLTIGEVTFY